MIVIIVGRMNKEMIDYVNEVVVELNVFFVKCNDILVYKLYE